MYYEEGFADRTALIRRMFIISWLTLIISIICIILGIVSVSVSKSQADFPFSAGAAMVGGISALILTCCPMYLYCENKRLDGDSTSGCFDCCIILKVVWFSIAILAVCFSFGVAGIYAVVACTNEEVKVKVCSTDAGTKIAISVVAIIATSILFILTLAIFFTCCCNAAKFGMPLIETPYSHDNYRITMEQIRNIRRQREIAIQQTLAHARMDRQHALEEHTNSGLYIPSLEPSAPNISTVTGPSSAHTSGRGGSPYSDPPPSYEEVTPPSYEQVMKKEQTSETAI